MKFSGWLRGTVLGAGLSLVPVVFAAGAQAADPGFPVRTTGDLAALCAPRPVDPHAIAKLNFCHGFAQGVLSGELERVRASQGTRRICLPSPGPTRTQTLAEFVKWVQAIPANANELAAAGLLKFLGERYPCPAGR